jgi:Holliday junction resolvasome RuvABC endonuclease subunit
MILSLDLGTNCGWAINVPPNDRILSGTQSFKTSRFEGGGFRYLRFNRWLSDIYEAYPFSRVVFEEVRRHLSTDAAHVHGGLLAMLTAWCEERQIPYMGCPVGTIKKHATGKGNASKKDMITAIIAAGYRPGDDNEADAIALLRWALDPSHGGLIVPKLIRLAHCPPTS